MDLITLEVKSRQNFNVKALRRENLIPAVFYGKGQENRNLAVDYQTFRRAYKLAGGNTVLELIIDGKDKTNVLVHDVEHDPVTDKFTHIDFIYVDLDKEVTTEVPLELVGDSKAVRELGGTLMQNRDVITVKCIARNIPKKIEVDITPLEDFHSSIHIEDIKLPEGVSAVDDPQLTVATVVAPKAEEEVQAEEEVKEGEEATSKEAAKEEKEEAKEAEKEKAEESEKKE
jgi:large subunit ribosomal protein L25